MDIKIINMTPHTINIMSDIVIPSDGMIRMSSSFAKTDEITTKYWTINIMRPAWSVPESIIPEERNTIYIVSYLTCQALPNRWDLYIPAKFNSRDKCVWITRNPLCKAIS